MNMSFLKQFFSKPHHRFARRCFSQEGEDMILRRYFGQRKSGFYVDIGAHHPFRYSNTYMFYKKGWRGINIDATPGSMKLFERYRPHDTNLEMAITRAPETLEFFLFDDHAYNTFSPEQADKATEAGANLLSKQAIPGLPLADVLAREIPPGRAIDIMSVDVEGMDLDVLKSNDWEQFRPHILLVECLESDLLHVEQDPVYQFLTGQNYRLYAKTVNTWFFVSSRTDNN
jgi:FkbM family methyltransferase